MDEQISPKKNPFILWLKGWATKILLFTVAMLLLGLTSFIFDSLGLIDPETYGSDPVDLIWQIFWAIVWIMGILGIFAVIYEVWKNRKE
jgi:hypothetical protein